MKKEGFTNTFPFQKLCFINTHIHIYIHTSYHRLAKPLTPAIIGDKKSNDTEKPIHTKSIEGDQTKRAMPKQVCKSDVVVIHVDEEDMRQGDVDTTDVNNYSNIQVLPPETLI